MDWVGLGIFFGLGAACLGINEAFMGETVEHVLAYYSTAFALGMLTPLR